MAKKVIMIVADQAQLTELDRLVDKMAEEKDDYYSRSRFIREAIKEKMAREKKKRGDM